MKRNNDNKGQRIFLSLFACFQVLIWAAVGLLMEHLYPNNDGFPYFLLVMCAVVTFFVCMTIANDL